MKAPQAFPQLPAKMSTSLRIWIPSGSTLSNAQALALAVEGHRKPHYSLYLSLLANQVQKLVDSDKKEARRLFEEYCPQLATDAPLRAWGVNLVQYDDSMGLLLGGIDWTQSGTVSSASLLSLWEVLEQLP